MQSGWYLSSPSLLNIFPRGGRWDSPLYNQREGTIVHVTIRGVKHGHHLYSQKVITLKFRFPRAELSHFQLLHNTVGGDVVPFYFVPDLTNMGTVYHVRKEPGFDPQPVAPGVWDGVLQQWFDYSLVMEQEIEPVEIEE